LALHDIGEDGAA
jgi:hypothetical protein